jgi:hypothetical protein
MFRVLATATAASSLFCCTLASAVPFGATVVGASTYVPTCSSATGAIASLTVDVASRLLVTIGGAAVTPDASNGYGLAFSAQLFAADGTTLVAESYGNSVSVSVYQTVIADSEVLVDPAARQPYQLEPGDYTLKLAFETSGSCGGNGPYVESPQLTYVLLSSVFDRIFASGFADASESTPRSSIRAEEKA